MLSIEIYVFVVELFCERERGVACRREILLEIQEYACQIMLRKFSLRRDDGIIVLGLPAHIYIYCRQWTLSFVRLNRHLENS